MAKMFYTLDEAAQRLGVDIEKVKEMAASGDIQQFRDRDKLMFKRDQIDTLAGGSGDSDSGSPIPLVPSDDTDAISLADTNMASKPGLTSTGTGSGTGTGTGSGMSVFGPDEVEPVDPLAQTAVTTPMDDTAQEDLSLESVGSGSGLLDLTRESDDTSLGAELLDEIYPGGTNAGEGSLASGIGSSGVFESAISMETGTGASAAGGLTDLQGTAAPTMGGGVGGAVIAAYDTGIDAAGSGFGAGMLMGATISLVIALIVTISAILDVQSAITGMMTGSGMTYGLICGGLLVGSVVLGVVGMMVGKAGA